MAGGCPRVGWDRISNISGHAAPGGYKFPEKEGSGELLSANTQQVAALADKGMGSGAPTASHIDLWPSLFLEFSRKEWQGWGFLA